MKKNKTVLILLVLLITNVCNAQERLFTKSGEIIFFSRAPMESIEAFNKNVTCVLDKNTGAIQFAILVKGFEFKKALMQEHFNENYLESNKYPKSVFKGKVTNLSEINFSKDGKYDANVKGSLSIHGVTKEVETKGTITVKAGKVATDAVFTVLLSEYNIKIPSLVKDKISNNVKITVSCILESLKT